MIYMKNLLTSRLSLLSYCQFLWPFAYDDQLFLRFSLFLYSRNLFLMLSCGEYVKGITLDVFLPGVLVSTGARTPVPSE